VTGATPSVAFDVTPSIVGTSGIARYVNELGRALDARGVELQRFAVGRALRPVPPGTHHLRVPLRVVRRAWWLAGRPRAETIAKGGDVVHATAIVVPATRRPFVSTVYDLAPLDHPELHTRHAIDELRAQIARLRHGGLALAISDATAARLESHGVEAGRIVVTRLGAPALPAPTPASETLPTGGPFVLAVGELRPRKALDVLLDSIVRPALDGMRVVLAGPSGAAEPSLRAQIGRLGIGDRVTFAGAVDDVTLAGLYRDATALCFPSVAEGFGLPVLEAMAAGTPVVATDLDVVREVAGDAALLVPPRDVEALSVALALVATDAEVRSRLVRDGRARAAMFTWAATADATIAAYERAAST
jgi:glycosyltransferase involved in cell wall biosynthesis